MLGPPIQISANTGQPLANVPELTPDDDLHQLIGEYVDELNDLKELRLKIKQTKEYLKGLEQTIIQVMLERGMYACRAHGKTIELQQKWEIKRS